MNIGNFFLINEFTYYNPSLGLKPYHASFVGSILRASMAMRESKIQYNSTYKRVQSF